ncbi:GPI mannosyltransferase 1 isoform X1 [Lethenteron reissneri]|uniref:GPI mannosyltransferase 1 isoform X1 n=2 Tax=Lethenteron reissneri TaxID=7753 RepID=UPI002AB67591|nr:GPI mannosyltransferase 1 isoform X1 [Lethenteron reissneri]
MALPFTSSPSLPTSTPPHSTSTPPHSTSTPPHSTSTPPHSTSTPPHSTSTPPATQLTLLLSSPAKLTLQSTSPPELTPSQQISTSVSTSASSSQVLKTPSRPTLIALESTPPRALTSSQPTAPPSPLITLTPPSSPSVEGNTPQISRPFSDRCPEEAMRGGRACGRPAGAGWVLLGAVVLRVALLLYGEYQDRTHRVKFTDVDYRVFTDAARYVAQGESPYRRETYRYTPLLAWLLLPNALLAESFGKLLFAACDVAAGWLALGMLPAGVSRSGLAAAAACWLLNPIPAAVSCRGNAESVLALLVLATLRSLRRGHVATAGLLHGVAAHAKIYPVIYTLPIVLNLASASEFARGRRERRQSPPPGPGKRLVRNTVLAVEAALRSKDVWTFVLTSASVFAAMSAFFFYVYGWEFVEQTYLYHVTRRDTRHNFSPYFYALYLAGESGRAGAMGLAAFAPQAAVLAAASLRYAGDLPFCCFVVTVAFVAFNKVCTSQYFLWYLCLLPPVLPSLALPWRRGLALLAAWLAGQALWLLPAYLLEFEGWNVFLSIWAAGLLFLVINCVVLQQIIVHYRPPRPAHNLKNS